MIDFFNMLCELESWKVLVIVMNGMIFDLLFFYGCMLVIFFFGIVEFECDFISEWVKLGLVVVKVCGKKFG